MIRVKRKPLTSCTDVLPGSDKVTVMFKVEEDYHVGKYRPEENMFYSSGSPETKFVIEQVDGWKALISNPQEYVEVLRREAESAGRRKPEEVVAAVSSLPHLIDLSFTGRRKDTKAIAKKRKLAIARDKVRT